ncbi:hypothetical protein BVG16_29380 [Paenibacillus selenitireducens]|uniref:Uncharacterized protein n=1 Tax=Paenibacillus selenitireducens TaxID=1324314 RepID=A0A1T2X0B6_9BACL|nr:Ger(x)C family spore germination protein [Paenibacillus selenitireducens]OPA73318.1 hypothetical protein BVG16_29380 [Paenibacillus selenitireducens]
MTRLRCRTRNSGTKILRIGKTCAMFSVCCMMILSLTGCWDIKSVQDINYITGLGIDYKNGKYVVYTQTLDFSRVAKQEGAKSQGKPEVWVGRGEGLSLDAAVNDIYTAATLQIVWDHVAVIVFSEDALRQDVFKMMDSFLRFAGIRYTQSVFGTKEYIPDLFITPPIPYNISPLASILHAPYDVVRQQAVIPPIRLRLMVVELTEPGSTLLLPSLAITNTRWKESNKEVSQFQINGAFALQDGTYRSWFSQEQMNGLRWVSNKVKRTHIDIGSGEKPQAVLTLNAPKLKVDVALRGGVPKYKLKINIHGNVDEVTGNLSKAQMTSLAEQKIRDEVKRTFETGLQHKTDVYSLRNYLYHKYVHTWKRKRDGELLQLTPDSIEKIEVKVQIEHAGMNQLHRTQFRYRSSSRNMK